MKKTSLSDAQRKTLKRRRRLKKKNRKRRAQISAIFEQGQSTVKELFAVDNEQRSEPNVASLITEAGELMNIDEPLFQQFSDVFSFFSSEDHKKQNKPLLVSEVEKEAEIRRDSTSSVHTQPPKTSKKKLKKRGRPGIEELKVKVRYPEVVETWDAAALDPALLVALKSYRNTVPVPFHWRHKRRYLHSKKDYSKPPYLLPGFIKDTGVDEIRQSMKEKEIAVTLKGKIRQRREVTVGRFSVDYQKLYDAFFLLHSKPRLTIHGDLYYEGKQLDIKRKGMIPGVLSNELRAALEMNLFSPPPYLTQMQRFGPPPSYPHLKIPGLNAPIPEGCQWGYHPGGWGKLPVDNWNRPLYGGDFAVTIPNEIPKFSTEVDRTLWGELDHERDQKENGVATVDEHSDNSNSGDEDTDENSVLEDDFLIEGLGPPPEEMCLSK